MSPGPILTREAHAKVNLALAVGPLRAGDGMHPIASWMTRIDLADTLTMQRLGDGASSRFEVIPSPEALRPEPIGWPIGSDLAVRAVRAMEAEAGRPLPVAIRVVKRIPTGAGLGGGSSDAGAALLMIRELFDLAIDDDRLRGIALGLGSDVPFFLEAGPALVTGLGDEIERTRRVTGSVHLALFVPPFGCPTGAVYGAFDGMDRGAFRSEEAAALARRGVLEPGSCFNDLALPAERVAPGLAEFRARIEAAASVRAHVTGSGSAMFVVCPDGAEAERVLESARRFAGPIAGMATRIID